MTSTAGAPTKSRKGSLGDVRESLETLSRFAPKARRSVILIGAVSFVAGMTEAGSLVLLTSAAVSTAQDGAEATSVAGVALDSRQMLFGALAMIAINVVLSVVLARIIANVGADAGLAARQRLLNAFHRASYQTKSADRLASLQEALTTYVDRFTAAFSSLSALLAAALSAASFAVTATLVSPVAALALVLIGLLLIGVLRPATRRTRRSAHALAAQRRAYAAGATESVLMSRELSVFGVDGAAAEVLRQRDQQVSDHFRVSRFLFLVTPRIYQNVALALATAALLALRGIDASDLAAVGAVALLLVRSLAYGQQLLTGLQQQADHQPYIRRLVEMLERYEASPRVAGATKIGPIETIAFDGIGFTYGGDRPALEDVTFDITAGETIGVLGPSGAGKSTFANVLLRLYSPTDGAILVNGTPLSEVDDTEWHQRVALVPQEPRLLHGTIADNIRFMRDIDDDQLATAAREAHILDFVMGQPDGFESTVGELGMGLSGGQRQRVCIARALAGHPDLLVLDEPTSALDGDSEAAIQRTLEELKGRVTMVVVAHRLSTLTICDRLAVFQDGKLAALGTPEELLATSSYYREALRLAGL